MADVNLHLFTHWLLALIAKLFSDFEESLLDLLLDTRIQLFFHIVKFEILAFELLQRTVLASNALSIHFARLNNILLNWLVCIVTHTCCRVCQQR